MNALSYGYGTVDPNVLRAVEETIACCNDIELRVQALKTGIAQAFPHVTPVANAGTQIALQIAAARGQLSPFATGAASPLAGIGTSPFGVPTSIPSVGFPSGNIGYATPPVGYASLFGNSLAALPSFGLGVGTPFASIGSPWTSLASPFVGVTHPLAMGAVPFRPF